VHAGYSLEADYATLLVGQLAQQVAAARQPVKHRQTTMKRGDALAMPSPSPPPCMMRMPTRAMTMRSKPCSPSFRYARCLMQLCSVVALLLHWSLCLAAAMNNPVVPALLLLFLDSALACISQQHTYITVLCEHKMNWTKLQVLYPGSSCH